MKEKIVVCHNGREIEISENGADAHLEIHLSHGDSLGDCENDGGFEEEDPNDENDAGDCDDVCYFDDEDAGNNLDSGLQGSLDAGEGEEIVVREGDSGIYEIIEVDGGPVRVSVPASCHCGATSMADLTIMGALILTFAFLSRKMGTKR